MSSPYRIVSRRALLSLTALVVAAGLITSITDFEIGAVMFDRIGETQVQPPESGRAAKQKRRGQREAYFNRLLRDPKTGRVPTGIRARELQAARLRPTFESVASKRAIVIYDWREAGPNDVGGRSRAVVVDDANENVLMAGGVSGGIWKSEDRGLSWRLVSEGHLSVTSIAQDTRPGETDTWYASTGEYPGSFNSAAEDVLLLFGTGLYKSTDGGNTWTVAQTAGNRVSWETPFDMTNRVVVSRGTGTVFLSDHAQGIWRSSDGGQNFDLVLGTARFEPVSPFDEIQRNDIAIDAQGRMLAVLTGSAPKAGVFRSTDDGLTWTPVLAAGSTDFPAPFDSSVARTEIAIAPSNPDVAYLYSFTGQKKAVPAGEIDDIRFHKLTISTGTYEDRSANMPLFTDGDGQITNGQLDTQGAYNQTMAVHPNDENHVFIGGTVLYRSRDGFATAATDRSDAWIGGYAISDDNSNYPNNHPDQHALFFDPHNANRLYNGHDGGLSVAEDVMPSGQISWSSLNNSFNVTQFVTISIPREAGDDRILGGTQDNGSPFFRFDGTATSASNDVSSGDGGWAYLGSDLLFASSQNGLLSGQESESDDTPSLEDSDSFPPCEECGALFVNPGAIEPIAEETVYYPAGADLYRIDFGGDQEWVKLDAMTMPSGYGYSALTMSTEPRGVLYVGGYSWLGAPVLFRLDDAETSLEAPQDRSIPGAEPGSYLLHIAVNPLDADEILVTISSYNVESLYHSFDGGVTYTGVEGNLAGEQDGTSVRTAVIADFQGEKTYFVGTSTGVYGTQVLAGDQTVWGQVAPDVIGQAPMAWLDHRISDGKIAAASHGRGVFVATARKATTAVANETQADLPAGFALHGNYPNPFNPTTSIVFDLSTSADVSVVVSDLLGRTVQTISAQSFSAGSAHTISLDASSLASGTYLYRLEVEAAGQTGFMGGSMVLLK